ncbi:phospho-N-acetylmuramoyl-pentapeptide-transferase [Alkalispirochaeta sphaeroplastigenens]|uniref:Phospho-N-acetylmuramoyl-pentapeptide-transferase n=1 Tax=Alkalispirochaeta sphaeroplastigenens TaxID=1187066 RepID=A0A2S4JZ07_9SPIO|nr:phospho-N-acetylmuramoyl-pentapeptide-transferase [Alkalispirochaeta sphaeroplastigenens]POR04739.1 phospho-N-acetylmuramoyl-pentapeptide-transferase [Alkalispirochaeta sphaeroplastigenens]
MLKELLFPLSRHFTPFNVFQYITFRAAYAAVTALLITFLCGPWVIQYLRKLRFGEEIRADGPETHQQKSGTPTMGGVLIIFSIVVSGVLWLDISVVYSLIGLLAVVGFGAIGMVDDLQKILLKNKDGLHGWGKILGQVTVALVIALLLYHFGGEHTTELYVPFFKRPLLDLGIWYVPFAVLLLVGTSNAVNLTDGLDGLATGLVLMVSLTFGVITYVSGRVDYAYYLQIPYIPGGGELAVLSLAVAGACVGFLWFNSHPAEIMMGDTGSLSLGGVIGVLALMIKKEILLVIVGGVFVMEAVSVIVQVLSYKLRGKRVFRMAPVHHHFELLGWSETKVVLRLWILGGLFAILSLSTLKIR